MWVGKNLKNHNSLVSRFEATSGTVGDNDSQINHINKKMKEMNENYKFRCDCEEQHSKNLEARIIKLEPLLVKFMILQAQKADGQSLKNLETLLRSEYLHNDDFEK